MSDSRGCGRAVRSYHQEWVSLNILPDTVQFLGLVSQLLQTHSRASLKYARKTLKEHTHILERSDLSLQAICMHSSVWWWVPVLPRLECAT